jgi:hypothetical protein
VLDYFDFDGLSKLVEAIYTHIKLEVEQEIGRYWQLAVRIPSLEQLAIGGKVNNSQFRLSVEQCMKKDVWFELKPYVEKVAFDLFSSVFVAQFKERLPYWIGIAAHREVTRSINQIVTLIPETADVNIYSEEYMFGMTPIKEALDRASLRLLDPINMEDEKTLILISDGEFEWANPLFEPIRVAQMLQQAGVKIISLYIGTSTVMRKGSRNLLQSAPEGAKILFEMASRFDREGDLEKGLITKGISSPKHNKLFIHVNKPSVFDEALTVILNR